MSPRPAPDLRARRDQVLTIAREIAESQGWPAVTMRRLATELGVTQPVLYTVFDGRQALVDAVALQGFDDLAVALQGVDATPSARLRAYLDFAAENPRTYEAMFSMPSGLPFAAADTPEPLQRAFAAVSLVFPDADGTRAEVAWSLVHGLATLEGGARLTPGRTRARLELAARLLTQEEGRG